MLSSGNKRSVDSYMKYIFDPIRHHKLNAWINELYAALESNLVSFTNDHASQLDSIDRCLTVIMLAGERQSSRKPQHR